MSKKVHSQAAVFTSYAVRMEKWLFRITLFLAVATIASQLALHVPLLRSLLVFVDHDEGIPYRTR